MIHAMVYILELGSTILADMRDYTSCFYIKTHDRLNLNSTFSLKKTDHKTAVVHPNN